MKPNVNRLRSALRRLEPKLNSRVPYRTQRGANDMLDPDSVRRVSLVALEIEGVVLNILLFLRLCRGEVKAIFGSSRRRKKVKK